MASGVARRAGKKNRKHGRNKTFCKAYALSHVREKNKARRLKARLRRFPDDACAVAAVARCKEISRGG